MMANIPTYKVDLDGQIGLYPHTLCGEVIAAVQDVSRPIFRRSTLETIEESEVLLSASCQAYAEC